jgi:hypothetical protein
MHTRHEQGVFGACARHLQLSLATALLLSVTMGALAADDPIWVSTHGAQTGYPRERFLTGFGMSPAGRSMQKHEKVAYAENAARVNLSLMLSASIESEAIIDSFSAVVNGNEELVDAYKSKSVTRSDLNLDGVIVDHYWEKDSQPAYALAYLDRVSAREHYADKLKSKMKILIEHQTEGNRQIAARDVPTARDLYLKCDRIVDEIEEIIVIQDLLGGGTPLTQDELKQIVGIKAESRKLWESSANTLEDAADQLAMKLALQIPAEGKVQINALMLEDSYQYSQFSGRFRTILERAVSARTSLSPMTADELDFTPSSSRIARHGVAANGADYLLAGTYFVKPEGVDIYLRLSDTKTSTVAATANARALNIAVKGLELKPRNYLQALQDRNVFRKDEMVGGSLILETWTSRGVDGLVLEDGNELKVMVRVNQPCYLRFIYHLNNGARVIPDRLYMNYFIGADKVNQVVELPDTFEVCAPFGSETLQMFASNTRFPPVELVDRKFEGEEYEVISDTLLDSNTLYRGLKRKKKEVEVTEVRIPLTTIAKTEPEQTP